MHELAICQSILAQAVEIGATNRARRVTRITLRIGPLAGVEPLLLRAAFPLAAVGTACAGARIAIATTSVRLQANSAAPHRKSGPTTWSAKPVAPGA
jgi:hydrogenase nickel incorporation protein HypA/HybF